MKIVFLLTLLANIFFFFWEYNSIPPNSFPSTSGNPKQILLLSELSTQNSDDTSEVPENNNLLVFPESTVEGLIDSEIDLAENNNIANQEINASNLIVYPQDEDEIVTGLEALIEDNSVINPFPNENSMVSSEEYKHEKLVRTNLQNENQIHKKLVYCYQVGPFENKDKLREWRRLNKINEGSSQPFFKHNQNDVRYLVYYPAAADYEESEQNVQIFIDMGITDYWLFKSGNLKGAISLGLYDKAVDALALKENFFNLGVNVEIRESYSNGSALYARVLSIDEKFKETAVMSAEQMVVECE